MHRGTVAFRVCWSRKVNAPEFDFIAALDNRILLLIGVVRSVLLEDDAAVFFYNILDCIARKFIVRVELLRDQTLCVEEGADDRPAVFGQDAVLLILVLVVHGVIVLVLVRHGRDWMY